VKHLIGKKDRSIKASQAKKRKNVQIIRNADPVLTDQPPGKRKATEAGQAVLLIQGKDHSINRKPEMTEKVAGRAPIVQAVETSLLVRGRKGKVTEAKKEHPDVTINQKVEAEEAVPTVVRKVKVRIEEGRHLAGIRAIAVPRKNQKKKTTPPV
jgi:hypothetical protein